MRRSDARTTRWRSRPITVWRRFPVPPRGGRIATDDVRERIEDALVTAWGPLEKGSYVDAVNFTDVYFADGVFDKLRANTPLMASVVRGVEEIPGVARVLRVDQLSDTSRDPIVRMAALSSMSSRSGDLMIVPKEYWFLGGRNVGGRHDARHASPVRHARAGDFLRRRHQERTLQGQRDTGRHRADAWIAGRRAPSAGGGTRVDRGRRQSLTGTRRGVILRSTA